MFDRLRQDLRSSPGLRAIGIGSVSAVAGIELGAVSEHGDGASVNSTGFDEEIRTGAALAGVNIAFNSIRDMVVIDPFAEDDPSYVNPFEAPTDCNPLIQSMAGF